MDIRTGSDVEKFITTIDKSTIAKVLRTIDLLERFGHQLGPPHTKKVRGDLFELRIRGQQEVRIFYTFHKEEIVLLHGFVKKSQKILRRDLEQAIRKLQGLT